MNKQCIYVLIGVLISGIIMRPLWKKSKEKQKAREEEISNKIDDMFAQVMEEEQSRSIKDIDERIEKWKEESDTKIEEIKKGFKRIRTNGKEIGKSAGLSMPMKYKDENGVIHEFDSSNYDEFCRVMSNKNYTLIFPTADDL